MQVKTKTKPSKSKKQRQAWFVALSDKERANFIESKVASKQKRRDAKMKRYMIAHKLEYDCSRCYHGIGGHCTDITDIGCTYYADESIWSKTA